MWSSTEYFVLHVDNANKYEVYYYPGGFKILWKQLFYLECVVLSTYIVGNAHFCLYTYILDLMVYLGLLRVLHPDKKEVLRQSVEGGIMPPSL